MGFGVWGFPVEGGREGEREGREAREGSWCWETLPKPCQVDSFSELLDILQDPKKWLRLAAESGEMGIRLVIVGQKQTLEQLIGKSLNEEQVTLLCHSCGTFFMQGIATGGLTWLKQTLTNPVPLALHLLDLDLNQLMVLEPVWDYAQRQCLNGLSSLPWDLPAQHLNEIRDALEDLGFRELLTRVKEVRDLHPPLKKALEEELPIKAAWRALETLSLLLVKDSRRISA